MLSKKSLKDVRFARAYDVMTKSVVCIDGKATVADGIDMMRKKKVSSLLVSRRDHTDAWGIVTRKDIVNKIVDPGKDPHRVKIFEIMTKPLVTVSPGLALKYCARLMHTTGIRRAVVFDGKDIMGILSNSDIFNAIKI